MNADEPKSDTDRGNEPGGRTNEELERELCPVETKSGKWQEFYLQRLERLIALDADFPKAIGADEDFAWKAKLLRKAIYASFCDCIELEVKDEAKGLLKETSRKG